MTAKLAVLDESGSIPEGERLESLAAELMRCARESSDGTRRVLLDVQDGDLRCVLLCNSEPAPPQASVLSPREQEIARMIAEGYPNKSIAAVLEISTWTVGTYLRRMFAKLGVTSRAAMIAKLLQERLL